MGTVIDLMRCRRQRERRAYLVREIPVELMELIRVAEMDPRHGHLNALLDQRPKDSMA
jgi:hypothetical protein